MEILEFKVMGKVIECYDEAGPYGTMSSREEFRKTHKEEYNYCLTISKEQLKEIFVCIRDHIKNKCAFLPHEDRDLHITYKKTPSEDDLKTKTYVLKIRLDIIWPVFYYEE